MKKFSRKILVTASVIFTCLSLNSAFADAVKTDSKPQTNLAKNISESTSNSVEDPDLKLSIEELRKKYPIDWLKKKYGDSNHETCIEEPEFPTIPKWPCGPFCSKYPNSKNCPSSCYNYCNEVPRIPNCSSGKDLPKNLVCTFFGAEWKTEAKSGSRKLINVPLPRFEDFSISEIKSSFIHYNYYNKENPREARSQEVIVITFMHFISLTESKLSEEERILKSFVFSKKINHVLSKESECIFIAYLIDPVNSIPDLKKSFCSHFINQKE